MLLREQFARLVPAFREKALFLLERCEERGVTMYPNELIRSPYMQGQLWCRGRSPEMIGEGIVGLERDGAPFLAACLRGAAVAPAYGGISDGKGGIKIVTNALPGLSWHQWGEAMDCCWLVDGRQEWSIHISIEGSNGYAVYGEEAVRLGLEAGYFWASKDAAHVQLRQAGSPRSAYSMREIDREMEARYALKA